MCSLINKQLLLTAYAYLFIMEQQKGQQGSEALQLEMDARVLLDDVYAGVHAGVVKAEADAKAKAALRKEFEEAWSWKDEKKRQAALKTLMNANPDDAVLIATWELASLTAQLKEETDAKKQGDLKKKIVRAKFAVWKATLENLHSKLANASQKEGWDLDLEKIQHFGELDALLTEANHAGASDVENAIGEERAANRWKNAEAGKLREMKLSDVDRRKLKFVQHVRRLNAARVHAALSAVTQDFPEKEMDQLNYFASRTILGQKKILNILVEEAFRKEVASKKTSERAEAADELKVQHPDYVTLIDELLGRFKAFRTTLLNIGETQGSTTEQHDKKTREAFAGFFKRLDGRQELKQCDGFQQRMNILDQELREKKELILDNACSYFDGVQSTKPATDEETLTFAQKGGKASVFKKAAQATPPQSKKVKHWKESHASAILAIIPEEPEEAAGE